ncbi:uracil-DNA glycosylase [Pseudomonas sp. MWU12-2534b]|nr:uracil-DNA glycosylase [Pseudomonas sp. MWU12-2534b]
MNASTFVKALSAVTLTNVFNPYSDVCAVHDRSDAAASRRRNLRAFLQSAESIRVDTIWMGRDLGYRGGRRTGLALTDEQHLADMAKVYSGCDAVQATKGPAVAERTAAEIWAVLHELELPPLLWNVFPFHPYEPVDQFTNRKFSAAELAKVDELNAALIEWLDIRRIVGIGQDAVNYASRFNVEVVPIRHPSYGGTTDFRMGMQKLYGLRTGIRPQSAKDRAQHSLF